MGTHTIFNFLKAVAVYSLPSALLSPMWRLSPFIPMFASVYTHSPSS